MRNAYRSYMIERVCDVCGKRFITTSMSHAYKHVSNGIHLYHCSWKCHRAYEKGEKIILKPQPIPVKLYFRDDQYINKIGNKSSNGVKRRGD